MILESWDDLVEMKMAWPVNVPAYREERVWDVHADIDSISDESEVDKIAPSIRLGGKHEYERQERSTRHTPLATT